MGGVGIAKPGADPENRPMMTLLATATAAVSTASAAATAAGTPEALNSDGLGMQALNFLLSAVFTIIVLWLVIKIWKGELWKGK
jgi:hypothetical protein